VKSSWLRLAPALLTAAFTPLPLSAQTSTAQGIAKYREMLADGNPAELWEAKGEALWAEKRGPKNVSLQRCDLGKGLGVVKGAFVELPRWFDDTRRVQDLESRLLTCMQRDQGFDAAQIAATPFGRGEQLTLESLVAYVASQSFGLKFNQPQSH
jgi:L-cysteine S-thiosulfotransferase